jgi:hypothetical protein
MNNKKLIIIAAAVVVLAAAGLFTLKTFLFKPKKNDALFHPVNPAASKPEMLAINNAPAIHTSLSSRKKTLPAASAPVVKAVKERSNGIPTVSPEKIKGMLKLNAEINKLNEEAKVAQLKQEIKNLNKIPGSFGGGAAAGSDISLEAISKGAAIVNFGKKDVTMRVGMSYGGYKCLTIKENGVVLKKNNKIINLSLSI